MPWCTACVSAVMIVVSWPPPCVAVLVQNVICTDKRTHEAHAWRASLDAWACVVSTGGCWGEYGTSAAQGRGVVRTYAAGSVWRWRPQQGWAVVQNGVLGT